MSPATEEICLPGQTDQREAVPKQSHFPEEYWEVLGLTALRAETNEAQRMQCLQRVIVKMTARDFTPLDIQHELICCGFDISPLRIRAILDNQLVQAQVQELKRSVAPPLTTLDEETALREAAPDCIRLLHDVVRNPTMVVDPGDGVTPAKVVVNSTSDRLFAAKQLLDRYAKTAPVSHKKHEMTQKGIFDPSDLAEMKELYRKAAANESTGVEGD